MKTSTRYLTASRRWPRRQRGVSLITSLLFMVATLILGVSVLSINVMQERMIGNTKDHDLALQAAEAALRDAELDITRNVSAVTAFTDGCTQGLCTPPSQRSGGIYPSPLPAWHASLGFDWANAGTTRRYGQYTAVTAYPTIVAARPPVYVIEKLGALAPAAGVDSAGLGAAASPGTAYRITARGFGARVDTDTVVMLQTIYSMR